MRTSGMLLAVMAAFGLVACDKKPAGGGDQGKGKDTGPQKPKYFMADAWESWNSCKPGDFVEYEMAGGMRQRKTYDKKDGDTKILLKVENKMKEGDNWKVMGDPTSETVEKPKADGGKAADPVECPVCKKRPCGGDPSKMIKVDEKTEKRDIGGNKGVEVIVQKLEYFDCQGKSTGKMEGEFSKAVPGHYVVLPGGAMKVVDFKKS